MAAAHEREFGSWVWILGFLKRRSLCTMSESHPVAQRVFVSASVFSVCKKSWLLVPRSTLWTSQDPHRMERPARQDDVGRWQKDDRE
jgi:hypothetical protein